MNEEYYGGISNLIAICHILDDFKEFNNRLVKTMTPKHIPIFAEQLQDISDGKNRSITKKVKKFYSDNKDVIDAINKYTNITSFIYEYNDFCRKISDKNNLEFFYEYVVNHKKDIDKILKLLERIKELGFERLVFCENYDFSQETYSVEPNFKNVPYLVYLDNIELAPNYENKNVIKYRTIYSNYRIFLDINGEKFSEYGRRIKLNSLLFDPERLPKRIDKESTFDNIIELKKAQQQTSLTEDTINLRGIISDLDSQSNSISRIINRLESAQNREELLGVLAGIKNNIKKLETISTQYDSIVSEKETSLTPKVLERKKQCFKKRDVSIIHIK